MTAANLATGVAYALLDDQAINDLVSGRVFRPAIPEQDTAAMPQPCVVVTPAGGGVRFGGSSFLATDPRADIRVYGETGQDASDTADVVAAFLRNLPRVVSRGIVIYSLTVTLPTPMVDPDSDWPFSFLTASGLMGEETVS